MIKKLSYVFVLAAMFTNGVYGAEQATVQTSMSNSQIGQSFVELGDIVRNASILEHKNIGEEYNRKQAEYSQLRIARVNDVLRNYGWTEGVKGKARLQMLKEAKKDVDFHALMPPFNKFVGDSIPNFDVESGLLRYTFGAPFNLVKSNENTVIREVNGLLDELNLHGNIDDLTRVSSGNPNEFSSISLAGEVNAFLAKGNVNISERGWIKMPSENDIFETYCQKSTGIMVTINWRTTEDDYKGQRTDKIRLINISLGNIKN